PLNLLAPASAESPAPGERAQSAPAQGLTIAVAPIIVAQPASQAPLTIGVGPPEDLPRNCFVRVHGLPPTVLLSAGYAIAPGAWAIPLYALATLQMQVPAGVSGREELSIGLIGVDGALLAEAKVALVIAPPPPAVAASREAPAPPP